MLGSGKKSLPLLCLGVGALYQANAQETVPEDLSLKYVAVVSRHGFRTPLRIPSLYSGEWECTQRQLTLTHHGEKGESIPTNELYTQKSLSPSLPGTCYHGQLTPSGRKQMNSVGTLLRERYVKSDDSISLPTQFLPDILNPSHLFCRSTDTKRTLETAQCILSNLYPSSKRPPGEKGITEIFSKDKHLEDMYGRSSCSFLKEQKKAVKEVEEYKQFVEEFEELRDLFAASLRVKSFTSSWTSTYNTYECIKGSDLPLPEFMTEEVENRLKQAAGREGVFLFYNHSICSLSIGRFVKDIMSHIYEFTEAPESTPKFVLYSGHDNTLSPLLHGFQVYNGYHPSMGSTFIIELWQNDKTSEQFVRLLVNNKVVTLPGCEEFCSFEEFEKAANYLIPQDYAKECQQCIEVTKATPAIGNKTKK